MEKQGELIQYSETSNDVNITVHPEFLEIQSSPTEGVYAFAYTVSIENVGDTTIQLLQRHWFVYSAGAMYTEVRGEGVVGEQPIIRSGDVYQYSSGSVIKDPVGSMHGLYTFRILDSNSTDNDENIFEATIPHFDLYCPVLIH